MLAGRNRVRPSGHDGRVNGPSLLEPRFSAVGLYLAISNVCGCTLPEKRTTGRPHLSFTFGSTVTRASAEGICCVGPTITMLRLCHARMACLCLRPQRGVFGGRRSMV